MRSVQLSTEGTGNKGSSELNFHPSRDGHKEVRNGVVGEGHGFSEEDESRVNGVAEDVKNNRGVIVRVIQADLQQQHPQQQQPLGPIVRWERFLPLRSLKVLLVENDDSTRQVVSALLRNCSYEVTTAANGLQAWKILGDLTNHIDLILTEVVMPCLSGIGLLSKIMSHKTCKNIPVIMMSSHDSMGIVFKCLSKGAVDFLVKPIRKNELKNLWQHVWRRCHSSSGSGSESGIQTQKSAKSKSDDESDNNTGSNDEDDNASIGLNVRDGSDNGSGTQSSWTKRAIEVDSPQPMSPWDQLAEPHDSTCAQVIHPKPETFCNEWVPMTAIRNCQESKEQLLGIHKTDNVEMGKDLEIGVPRNPDLELESYPKEKVSTKISGGKDKLPQQDPKKDMQSNDNLLELNSNSPSSKLRVQAADLIGASNQISENRVAEAPNYLSKTSEIKDKATSYPQLPSLELSLKRLRSVGDDRIATQEDRNVLRRSDLSAFSRYTTANASSQATGCGGSSSLPLDNSSDVVKIESVYNLQSNPNVALNQSSNGSSNNNDMGSTTKNAFTKPAALKDKSISVPTAKSVQPSSAFQPVQQCHSYPPQKVMPEKVDVVAAAAVGQPTGAQRQVQVQHHHHHYHHHHHHVHSMQQQPSADPDDLSLKNMAAAAPQCGSSNVFGEPMEGNAGNYSLNGSVSGSNHGSNHGSNGQNGSSTAVNAGGLNIESDNGVVGKSVAAGVSGSGSGVDQNRFAQREAALTKFRQKRKERCFEKKVRYQSRKRLAEQRPRVRGQFVRQIVYEHTSREVDS
ncbi:two-component response regulator-like PRR37 isoform X2 [Magnolia sinica]|uniref:two-component response regulator-like PRR37 isoform X2 n=1 Tax=Magnolia sinica TaxID=86752 RepID=UPI0026580041|nr:two-component response regulator-like PRR37 isoform X2 [Magnolia sinica]